MRRVLGVLAAGLLAVGVTGCAARDAPSPSASEKPLVSVTVTVQGTGTATEVAVTVGDESKAQPNVPLPYSRTMRVPKGTKVSVSAQNGTDTGQITAQVKGGVKADSDTATGEFAAVQAGETPGETTKTKTKSGGGTMGDHLSVSPSPLPYQGEVVR